MTKTIAATETKLEQAINTYATFYSSTEFAAVRNELDGFHNLTELHEAEINK